MRISDKIAVFASLVIVALFVCSAGSTTGQEPAEVAASALHSRLAKYDRNFRPGYGGPPVQVLVELRELAFLQKDKVKIRLVLSWQDLRLAYEVEGVEEIGYLRNANIHLSDILFIGLLVTEQMAFGIQSW